MPHVVSPKFSLTKRDSCASRIALAAFASFLMLLLLPSLARAKAGGPEHITFESYYSTYSFFNGGSSSSTKQLTPSIDAELGIRLQSVFSFLIVGSGFTDPDPNNTNEIQSTQKGFGLGMRVELPGFFFFFSKKQDSSRDGKFYPVNSYMFGEAIRFDSTDVATGAKTTFTAPKYGFGADFFLFNPYAYLSVRYSLFSYLGSTYACLGAGVGVSL
jgi:hypothetical protein